jgi:hypothetical protein
MTYAPGSEFGNTATIEGGHRQAAAIERRVGTAIAACQTFLVVRILSVILFVSLLPAQLPSVVLTLDTAHAVRLPLGGLDRGTVLIVVAAVSMVELDLVYRLADRRRVARFGVLLIESCAIVLTTIALAYGASLAVLPLVTAIGATSVLLLNQVRWAFRLTLRQRALTGRRQGGTFAGYAAPSLDCPRTPQRVGYQARRHEDGRPQPLPSIPPAAEARNDYHVPSRSVNAASGWPSGSPRRRG